MLNQTDMYLFILNYFSQERSEFLFYFFTYYHISIEYYAKTQKLSYLYKKLDKISQL